MFSKLITLYLLVLALYGNFTVSYAGLANQSKWHVSRVNTVPEGMNISDIVLSVGCNVSSSLQFRSFMSMGQPKKELIIAAAALAVGAGMYYALKKKPKVSQRKLDSQAAFPTAQWIAAMRAIDARLPSPLIGSNIGGTPDLLAETLTCDEGFAILDKMSGGAPQLRINSITARTLYFDKMWANSLRNGCEQFVILASGLDSRAWRIPGMSKQIKVFEVDCPRAHAYKEGRLISLEEPPQLSCTRITVDADLADPSWTANLLAAGFDPKAKSFILVEGLLMYLPPDAPKVLLARVADLMGPGSVVAGCSFVNTLRKMPKPQTVEKLGTKWTFDFPSRAAITQQLTVLGLAEATAINVLEVSRTGTKGNAAALINEKAAYVAGILLSVRAWPDVAQNFVLAQTQQPDGIKNFVQYMVKDQRNTFCLRDASDEVRSQILEAIMSLRIPRTSADEGDESFPDFYQKELDRIVAERAPPGLLGRLTGMLVLMAMKLSGLFGAGESGYFLWSGTKPNV